MTSDAATITDARADEVTRKIGAVVLPLGRRGVRRLDRGVPSLGRTSDGQPCSLQARAAFTMLQAVDGITLKWAVLWLGVIAGASGIAWLVHGFMVPFVGLFDSVPRLIAIALLATWSFVVSSLLWRSRNA